LLKVGCELFMAQDVFDNRPAVFADKGMLWFAMRREFATGVWVPDKFNLKS